MPGKQKVNRYVKVTLPTEQAELIQNRLVGKFGNTRADVVGRIITDWLVHKELLILSNRKRGKR